MPAPKGNKYSTGRPTGSGNKVGKEAKQLIKEFVNDNFDEAMKQWKKIKKPEEKVKTFIMLLNYVLPKMTTVKVEDKQGEDILKRFLDSQK